MRAPRDSPDMTPVKHSRKRRRQGYVTLLISGISDTVTVRKRKFLNRYAVKTMYYARFLLYNLD